MTWLEHVRAVTRNLVWIVDTIAAAVGWTALALLASTGFSGDIFGFLLADFFQHYIDAPEEARGAFLRFAGPIFAGVVLLAGLLRWHVRPALKKGLGHGG